MKNLLILCVIFILIFKVEAQVLPVHLVTQEQNQWCWSAVSACFLDYYCHTTPQCEIAEYTRTVETFGDISFGNIPCCANPASCNNWNYSWGGPGSIQDILIHFGSIGNTGIGRALTIEEVATEIQNNRLFVIRWGWDTGGGHFVVGHGNLGDMLFYMNPWYGEGLLLSSYSWVCSGSGHTWTHTNTLDSTPPFSIPPTPTITQNGTILHSDAPTGNQWYNETGIINGAVNQDYQVTVTGDYYVITSNEGCASDTSNHIFMIIFGIENNYEPIVRIYPNPFSDQISIENDGNETYSIEIFNSLGVLIHSITMNQKSIMNTTDLSKGVYFVKISNGKTEQYQKLIKQ